ncbi:MAG: hypothetical protein HYY30_05400 [Chloroflexi bacterium]|nr:hypothetical protein [Chloroflexota bacterium]
MCESHVNDSGGEGADCCPKPTLVGATKVADFDDLLTYARHLRAAPYIRGGHVGMIGYGGVKAGERVLLAIDTQYDRDVVDAVATALRETGAHVDVICLDAGPDREFDYLDEVRVVMRRGPWAENPRRWEGVPWIEEMAAREKYDFLIHGKGGPVFPTPYRYTQVPWLGRDHFTRGQTMFPRDVFALASQMTWDHIWQKGKGGKVHLTDPEGTDLTFTLFEEYYDGNRRGWVPEPQTYYGHLMAHPTPPFIDKADTTGVAAGTTSHFTRPFPRVSVTMQDGCINRVEGGGPYGDAWREFLEESRNTHYLDFPRPGLFWLFEVAIGGHPKIVRPRNIHMLSSGGSEWERRRSGVIHLGFGTFWRQRQEEWAAEHRLLYGHLHIHLLFPTYDLTTAEGEVLRLIDNGRLTSLDSPEVRALAAKYGDPDELLHEDWIPEIPGINADGDYEEFARDPARWIYTALAGKS